MKNFSKIIIVYISLSFIYLSTLNAVIFFSQSEQSLDSLIINRILINEEIINAFKQFWNEENSPLNYDEYIMNDTIVGEFDYNILWKGIIDYIQNTDTVGDTIGIMDVVRKKMDLYVQDEEPIKENNAENEIIESNIQVNENDESKLYNFLNKSNKPELVQNPIVKKVANNIINNFTKDSILFKVQVAANREILPLEILYKKYKGKLPVFIKNEDGWYKYQIGRFYSYYDANILKMDSGVQDAFIIGYRNNKKIEISELKEIKNKYSTPSNQNNLLFKVQIAASKKILSKKKLSFIYQGGFNIDYLIENGWYKYQVGDFQLYDQADSVKRIINVPGAFIAAYLNGEKINIQDAISYCSKKEIENKEYLNFNKNNITYKLQIAADKNPLTDHKLMDIYKGHQRIQINYEDGWYKYLIGNYKTYNEVVDLKKKTDILNSFIVAYQNGKRINLSDAFKYTLK